MKQLLLLIKILFSTIILFVLFTIIFWGYRDIPLDELKAQYAPTPSDFISVNGMEVHYRDEGSQQDSLPLVLIHGTGSSLHIFDAWTDNLKQNYRVVRMDLPGYGLTGPFPDRDYSMDHYVDFFKQFLDALHIEKCIIGGNSLGGRIAWGFTVAHPETVEKLILIDAAGYPSQAKSTPLAFRAARIPVLNQMFTFITPPFLARKSVENVYHDKRRVTETLANRYFELTLREGNRQSFVDRMNTTYNPEAYIQIKQIQSPTLILWGEQDLLIPIENAYRFQEDLPNDTLVILPEVGHVPMEESPEVSLEAVVDFLKEE
ncbi:MAG: alpha/beta hydrolase [Bacteroidia bacterium]